MRHRSVPEPLGIQTWVGVPHIRVCGVRVKVRVRVRAVGLVGSGFSPIDYPILIGVHVLSVSCVKWLGQSWWSGLKR